jgi:hypothetical protein
MIRSGADPAQELRPSYGERSVPRGHRLVLRLLTIQT